MSNISKISDKQQEKFLLAQQQQAGRSSPLLARQRYLPIELHAQLMPFNKSVKAIIPTLPHPQFNHSVASNRSRNNAVIAAASALDPSTVASAGVFGGSAVTPSSSIVRSSQDWHTNRSISWSTKAAAIATKIVEASQQREARKSLRREATTTTTNPVSVLDYDDHSHTKNNNNEEMTSITENLLRHDDEDPSEIARTMLRKKFNLQQQQLQEQTICATTSNKITSRSQFFPPLSTADSDLANASWRILQDQNANHDTRNNDYNNSNSNSNNNNIQTIITSGSEAIAASQQLQAQALSQTGRGRERYPSHDDRSGAPIRNDPSVAVQQVEPQNPFFVYHGSYRNNKKSGVGRYIVGHDGSSYVGHFSDGEIEGRGTRYLGDGTVMQGSFRGGELHGDADCVVMSCSAGERYEGGFKYGRRDGRGTLTWRSGGKVQVVPCRDVDDDDDDDEDNQRLLLILKEEAFHQFEGEFENGEPHGVGIQTTTKVRTMISPDNNNNNNNNNSVCIHSKIVDTVEGFFNGQGPQGSCTRNVNRKFYDSDVLTATSREYYEGTYVNGKEQNSSSTSSDCNESQNVFKHIFTPVITTNNNNNNTAKKITYIGPMNEGMRTLIPNTLVLESIKVSPLIDFQQQQQQQVQTSSNSAPQLPQPLGSGRKNIINNNIQIQDNVSWLQPVSIPTGQELLTMKISLANLNGFRFPSSSSSSSVSDLPSSTSSCLIKEESGRLIQIQVFSVDLKQQTQLVSSSSTTQHHLALTYALRAVYENLGLEELFLKNVLFGFTGKTLFDENNNNDPTSPKNKNILARKTPLTSTKRQTSNNNNNNENEDLLEEVPDSENSQWEIELGIQTTKQTQFSNNSVTSQKLVSTPRSSQQQQQQQKIIPKTTALLQKQKEPSTSPTVPTSNKNKNSGVSNLFGLHLRTLMSTIFDSSSPGLSASAISSIINARKSFLESCLSNYCQLFKSSSPSNINTKRTICLQNGCSKEPLLILSSSSSSSFSKPPPTLLLTNYQYQHELQTELCLLAEEILANSINNNNIATIIGDQQQRNNNNNNGAAVSSSPNTVAIISDDIKKEHNVIEISSDLYLQHQESINNNNNNNNRDHANNDHRSNQRKRGSSLMANHAATPAVSPSRNKNDNNNNNKDAAAFIAMSNLVSEHMRQNKNKKNKSSSTTLSSSSLRNKIAGASAYYFSSNESSENNNNNNGDSGRKSNQHTSSRGGNTNLVATNINKKWKNAAASAGNNQQQQQNCSQFIQLVQSNFIEMVGNGESTEINLQLAPLQANVGDLLFVVVQVASPNILMTPGAEEIDLTSRLVPLVIPVLVGGSFHSNNNSGPKSPRK